MLIMEEHDMELLKVRKEVWLVFFYSNSNAKQSYVDKIKDLSKKVKGIARVYACNCSEKMDLCKR